MPRKKITLYDEIDYFFIDLNDEYEANIKDKSSFPKDFEENFKNEIYTEYEKFIEKYPSEIEKVNRYFSKKCHYNVMTMETDRVITGFIDDQIKLFEEIYSTIQQKCKETQERLLKQAQATQEQTEPYQATRPQEATTTTTAAATPSLQKSTSESENAPKIEVDTSNTSKDSVGGEVRSGDSSDKSGQQLTEEEIDLLNRVARVREDVRKILGRM